MHPAHPTTRIILYKKESASWKAATRTANKNSESLHPRLKALSLRTLPHAVDVFIQQDYQILLPPEEKYYFNHLGMTQLNKSS